MAFPQRHLRQIQPTTAILEEEESEPIGSDIVIRISVSTPNFGAVCSEHSEGEIRVYEDGDRREQPLLPYFYTHSYTQISSPSGASRPDPPRSPPSETRLSQPPGGQAGAPVLRTGDIRAMVSCGRECGTSASAPRFRRPPPLRGYPKRRLHRRTPYTRFHGFGVR